jgi:threonine dehydrogenase-like Zn-dependent dehydrogenase
MQIAVLTSNGFVLREAPRPECGAGEVLVRTAACGVCSSDIDRYRMGLSGRTNEVLLGHEGTGYVAAVGRGVKGLQEGDPVTSLHGPYAEYFVTTPDTLVRLPESVDPRWALGEPLACVVHAGRRFGIELGDRVTVLGCGFMGLICLQVARLRGAAHLCAVDSVPWRLEVAAQCGADATYQLPEDGLARGLGEFDVVLEAAGTQSAITLAGELVREHGRIVLIGYHTSGGGQRQVSMERWNYKAIDVINGHVRRDDEKLQAMKAAMDLLAAGRLQTESLVTAYPLDDAAQAFRDLADRKPGLLKVTLVPEAHASAPPAEAGGDCPGRRVMRKLKIDMNGLDLVWEAEPEAFEAYLDRETGQIITVTPDARGYLEEFDKHYQGEGAEEDARAQAFADWLAESDCPEWQREEAIAAYALARDTSDRYLSMPEQDSREGFRDMEDFVLSVEDEQVQQRLARALGGRGTFRRFKDALSDSPQERERWFQFQEQRKKQRILDWLEANDIEPVE